MPHPLRVLYVDDDHDIRTLVTILLEGLDDIVLHSVGSGAAALTAINDFAPDLVLLDVMMPDMDGPTTLLHLRRLPAGSRVPVVFITASAQPQEIRQLLACGGAAVISKPFAPAQLEQQIRAIWQECAA